MKKTAGPASEELIDLIRSTLKSGKAFRFRVRGGSMMPFIRGGDVIAIYPEGNHEIGTGDIIAFVLSQTGTMFVHRVVLKQRRFFLTRGDNLVKDDGWISGKNILGKVVRVERKGKSVFLGVTGAGNKLIALFSYTGILPWLTLPVRKLYQRVKVFL